MARRVTEGQRVDALLIVQSEPEYYEEFYFVILWESLRIIPKLSRIRRNSLLLLLYTLRRDILKHHLRISLRILTHADHILHGLNVGRTSRPSNFAYFREFQWFQRSFRGSGGGWSGEFRKRGECPLNSSKPPNYASETSTH